MTSVRSGLSAGAAGASQVSMVSWSLGGPRAGRLCSAEFPIKSASLCCLAPAYSRDAPAHAATPYRPPALAMGTQSRDT